MDCTEVCILVSHQITRLLAVIANHEGLQLDFTPQFEFISQYLCFVSQYLSLSTNWRGKFVGDNAQNQNCNFFQKISSGTELLIYVNPFFLSHS